MALEQFIQQMSTKIMLSIYIHTLQIKQIPNITAEEAHKAPLTHNTQAHCIHTHPHPHTQTHTQTHTFTHTKVVMRDSLLISFVLLAVVQMSLFWEAMDRTEQSAMSEM